MKLGALSKGAVVAAVAALSLAACSAQTGVVENTTVTEVVPADGPDRHHYAVAWTRARQSQRESAP